MLDKKHTILILTITLLIFIFVYLFYKGIIKVPVNCQSYNFENCPAECVVCPPCGVCSSISCQTEKYCESIGFNRTWYDDILNQQEETIRSQRLEYRLSTFKNCQNLVNKTVDFNGNVLYEECGKNCLGGCPNSGPSYCYYAVQDSNGCVVYIKSRITEFMSYPEEVFNNFDIGQHVELKGTITIYYSYYCNFIDDEGYQNEVPECSYFLID